ncbi:MAG: hypothetical protein ACREN8_11020, partial [Candidatus Dormibacteraceae bacterium]
MPFKKPVEDLAESTQFVYASLEKRTLSPRVRMALRMYALAAVPTLTAAGNACEVSLPYLSMMANSPAGKEYISSIQTLIDDQSISTTELLKQLGRKAVDKIATLMHDAGSDAIQLKA